MTYEDKAYQIIKDSIKSAIFIDERARTFFQPEGELKGSDEEVLSINLYQNFKENGISLAIHKFSKGEEKNSNLKRYLFEDRDLVLLDWKLDGDYGEDLSLELLADITLAPHINFCAIYTSSPDVSEIYQNILSYFSGHDAKYYHDLKQEFEANENELKAIFSRFNILNPESNGNLIPEIINIEKDFLERVKIFSKESNPKEAIKNLFLAFQKLNLSDIELQKPEVLSPDNNTIVINNTLIAILQKEKDNNVSHLIQRLATQFSKSKNSFTQLLGFEMQAVFSKDGSFIDSNLLAVSLEALLAHRKHIIEVDKSDIPFKVLIKNVLIEHASMRLRTAKLALLDDQFLNDISKTITELPSDESLAAMNVFYNSVSIASINPQDLPNLNFGDVFEDGGGKYFVCITALCDCYLPSKINNIFYFAEGSSISNELALTLGDTAFMSFLPNKKVVSWIAYEPDKFSYDKDSFEDSKRAVDYFRQFKYKPVYVKPHAYNVKSYKIENNSIEIRRVETKEEKEDLTFISLKYITTIRPSYTQRIANHAFAHPVRVGVDFVKKQN